MDFADAILFTDQTEFAQKLVRNPALRLVEIERLGSSAAYSDFMLQKLGGLIATSHALIVQWDGHIIDAARWRDELLDYDYVGASWPQFDDGFNVGNGGFSLRSRRLLEACADPEFEPHHPEDLAICRTNRTLLEGKGMVFAGTELANAFSAERAGNVAGSFGYHGVFLMPQVLGADGFWQVYCSLDDRSSLARDFWTLVKALQNGPNSTLRSLSMIGNWMRHKVQGK